jgi:hypothetical protein
MVDQADICSACSRPLCPECAHRIRGKVFCQDCLVRGAEWAVAVKDLRIPADAPKRAALCAIVPGIGAVYNGEYLKALTFFAIFAALVVMADDVHAIFGFGSVAFLIFTIFDAYRSAEARTRAQLEAGGASPRATEDRSSMAWGVFLIVLGVVFLLQNLIPFHFVRHMWPLMFILLGAYLVYRALEDRGGKRSGPPAVVAEKNEF